MEARTTTLAAKLVQRQVMPYTDDPGPHVPSLGVEARGVLPAPEERFLKNIFGDGPFPHHTKDDDEDDGGVPAVKHVHCLDIAAGGASHKITIGIPLHHGRTIIPTGRFPDLLPAQKRRRRCPR
jgi:hypothetical protein